MKNHNSAGIRTETVRVIAPEFGPEPVTETARVGP